MIINSKLKYINLSRLNLNFNMGITYIQKLTIWIYNLEILSFTIVIFNFINRIVITAVKIVRAQTKIIVYPVKKDLLEFI